MIRPIPKRLLPHNAIYKEYLGNTGEGDEWGADIPLSFVKIEEKMLLKVNHFVFWSTSVFCTYCYLSTYQIFYFFFSKV